MVEQETKRGAVFFRCARADQEESFARYPAIPVLQCDGFERRASGSGDHERDDAPGME